jgi:HSP20 family protein
MSNVEKRHEGAASRRWDWGVGSDLARWFEGFGPWFKDEDRLRVEQQLTDDTMIVRAEIPGIDPDKDVEITVENGVLHIRAERRSERTEATEGRTRSEFRYGMFERALRVPADLNVDDVQATYKDGILEVRAPLRTAEVNPPKKVPISRE